MAIKFIQKCVLLFSILVIIILMLVGCSPSVSTQPQQELEAEKVCFYQLPGFTANTHNLPVAGNEQGAYLIPVFREAANENGGIKFDYNGPIFDLLYIDYEKAEVVPLQGHELTQNDLYAYILCEENYLYGFYGASDSPNYIFRTDLQGKNRVEYSLPDDYRILIPSGLLFENGYCYFVGFQESQENRIPHCALFKLETAAGELKIAFEFPENKAYWTFVGLSDNGLLFSTNEPGAPGADSVGNINYEFIPNSESLSIYSSFNADSQNISNETYISNATNTHSPGNIVGESSNEYVILLEFQKSHSHYSFFPSLALINKEDYNEGTVAYREIKEVF